MAGEIRSELLCYLQNNFDKCNKASLITTLSGFYEIDEIVSAKAKLFEVFDDLRNAGHVIDGKHRPIQRKVSDNKRRLDTEDLLNLYADLDAAKVPLPTFTAGNLRRIPPFEPDATDFCSLAMTVRQLQSQVAVLQDGLSKVTAGPANAANSPVGGLVDVPQSDNVSQIPTIVPDVSGTTTADDSSGQPSWAATARADADKWTVQEKKTSSRPKPQVKIRGSAVNSDKIKSVPRVLAAYVGRLQKETTQEELTEYLSNVGMRGVMCKKLVPKNGKVYNTAAFYVTCCAESKDLFYNEGCWPEGVEVRDWVYYSK